MADPLVIDDAVAPPAGDAPAVATDQSPATPPIGEVDRARAPGRSARHVQSSVGESAVKLPAIGGGRLAGEVIERPPVDVAQDQENGEGTVRIAANVERPVDLGEGPEERRVAVAGAECAGRRGGAVGLRVDRGHELRSARELAVVEAAHALAEPFDALPPVRKGLAVGGNKVNDRGTDRVDRVAAIPGGEAGGFLAIVSRCGCRDRHHQAGKRHPGRKISDRSGAVHRVCFPEMIEGRIGRKSPSIAPCRVKPGRTARSCGASAAAEARLDALAVDLLRGRAEALEDPHGERQGHPTSTASVNSSREPVSETVPRIQGMTLPPANTTTATRAAIFTPARSSDEIDVVHRGSPGQAGIRRANRTVPRPPGNPAGSARRDAVIALVVPVPKQMTSVERQSSMGP